MSWLTALVAALPRIGQTMQSINPAEPRALQMVAFLLMIRNCEGTSGAEGYRTQFGYRTFTSFADHPRTSFPYTDQSGNTIRTSAAGAYQITFPTWRDEIQPALHLPDFTPESQDLAARWLIAKAGASEDVYAGRLQAAIDKCGGRWASLPSSRVAQPRKSYEFCVAEFTSAGGTLA